MRSLKETVFALPVSELELHPSDVKSLTERVQRGHERRRQSVPSVVTVQIVIEELSPYRMRYAQSHAEKSLCKALVGLGLNRLDCLILPGHSTSLEALKKVSHDDLLVQPALVLDIPANTLCALLLKDSRISDKTKSDVWIEARVPRLTVKELLTLRNIEKPKDRIALNRALRGTYKDSVLRTRELLLQLGFSARQYVFLSFGTREQEVAWFQKTHNFSISEAERMVTAARFEGFIPDFL